MEENLIFDIYNSDGTPFHDLVLKKSTYSSVIMSLDDKIEGDVYYQGNSLSFSFNEYIIYKDIKYYLKIETPPTILRKGITDDNSELKGMTKYSFTFYHPMSLLYNIPFTDIAVSNDENRYKSENSTFYWVGTLTQLVQKINKNLQGTSFTCSLQPDYVDDGTMSKVLSFDKQMISDVLKTTYETFEVPFVVDGYNILFGKPSNEIYIENTTTPYVFKLGQGLGLKNNDRTPKNNAIITKLAGFGSTDNIPDGYPKIRWTGNQSWNYTINNDSANANSYPIIDGVIDGVAVKLINHPFTRKNLMPTSYAECVNKKVNPNASGYNPNIELIDYYNAINATYWINLTNDVIVYTISNAPSLNDSVYNIDGTILGSCSTDKRTDYITVNGVQYNFQGTSEYINVVNSNLPFYNKHEFENIKPTLKGAKYNNQEIDIIKSISWINDDGTPASKIDDSYNASTSKYNQGYFSVGLYPLGFDLYAMAAVTSAMSVSMNSGACNGCKFELGVDWDEVKTNFYFTKEDGTIVFDPTNIYGNHRDYTKFPDSTNTSTTIIVKKDTSTFGTLMPNTYQQPKANDTFVFLGIDMPQTYITLAQSVLDVSMRQYMLENNIPYYEYPLDFDENFLTNNKYILGQIKTNSIVRFQYANDVLALSIKEYSITWGDKALPTYKITLTDDVSISLNQIGEVANGLSKIGSQVALLQASYNINVVDELNKKVSKVYDDTIKGVITFAETPIFNKDINVNGVATVNDLQATTGTFAGILKATTATVLGALTASTVSATTITASTFIGDLQGNAATSSKWKTPISVWGQNIDGSGRVNGAMTMDRVAIATDWNDAWHDGLDYHPWYGYDGRYPGTGVYSTTISDYYGMTLKTAQGNISMDGSGRVGVGTFSPAYRLDVNGNVRVTSDLYADATIGTRNFVSRTVGWNINAQGAADFRNIYADELRVQAFTADISQALAGSDYLTKSVSKLSANFVVPSSGGSVRIIVDDIEGMPATRCFSNGDYIRFRAFNRTSGLTIANVWGTVSLDTSFGTNGFSNGTQAYTFTCTATSGAGLTVFKGSEVLDYGTSGSGMISRTTLDAQGSPYEQIATWINDPSVDSNYTVHARLGNLNGIANCNGYGLYTDNGFFTGKITVGDLTKSNNYLDFSTGKLTVQGDIRLSSGYSAVSTFDMSNGISLAVDNIQVGGRNLFGYNKGIVYVYTPAHGEDKANNGFWFDTPSSGICCRLENLGFESTGGSFTISGYIKASASTTDCYLNLCDYDPVGDVNVPITTSYTYFSRTYENVYGYLGDPYYGFLDFENLTPGVRIFLKDFIIARGNKASASWTPAPEDVDASINLKVSKDGVIGAINLTSESATISASKINLVGAVTADSLTAGCVTTDKLGAHVITSDKVNMTEFTASTGFVDAFNANIVTANRLNTVAILTNALTGNTITANSATITNLTMTNATVSGTLVGVSGTFNYLQAVGSTGRFLFSGTYGRMTIEDDDFGQQGSKSSRALRYYSENIRCRGSFGASSLNMARVHDTVIDYYVNGDTNSYVRFNLQSNGVGGYYIPLYPTSDTGYSLSWGNAALGDVYGFPVDLLIFDSNTTYQYEMLAGSFGKKVTVVNAHDNGPYMLLWMINGTQHMLSGGQVQTYINIREFTNPLISSAVHGAGWMLCGEYDNNWA